MIGTATILKVNLPERGKGGCGELGEDTAGARVQSGRMGVTVVGDPTGEAAAIKRALPAAGVRGVDAGDHAACASSSGYRSGRSS